MLFKYGKLLGRIRERGETQESLALKIQKSEYTLNNKLNGKSFFRQDEIISICHVLDIDKSEISLFFFET